MSFANDYPIIAGVPHASNESYVEVYASWCTELLPENTLPAYKTGLAMERTGLIWILVLLKMA